MTCKTFFTLLLSISSCFSAVYSQNLEELALKKGVDVSGSINVSSIGYRATAIDNRRDPLNFFLTGNLNLDLFGYNAPFSFSYSNANKNYSQPFNQFSFSPSYKWIKTYVGYNSMTFSNYTLSGHVFLGGGIELTPGKWRVAAMYGRMRKAVAFAPHDTLQNTSASFKRIGLGIKLGYENNGDMICGNIFTAKDDLESIPFILPESQLSPMQNVAMSIAAKKKLFKHIFIDVEYAVSSMNHDIRANSSKKDSVAFRSTDNVIKGLLPENTTNRYYDAVTASIGYQAASHSIQIKFERIAPDYQTLGSYYFNNDLQNITLIPSMRLFKNTFSLTSNFGFQKNNLDHSKASTTKRFVGAINANYLFNENWNLMVSYSNFNSFTNVKSSADPHSQNRLDTLNFYQLSETLTAAATYTFGGKENPQSMMLNSSYQKASSTPSHEEKNQQSNFISMNVSYSYSHVPTATTLAIAANVYSNDAGGTKSIFYGPTGSVTKSFLEKKIRGSFATTFNKTTGNNVRTGPVWNNRLNISFSPRKSDGNLSAHNVSAGINILRTFESRKKPSFTELTGTLTYSFLF